jgi:N-acetylmuramic acid 6-phosphate etherase
MSSDLSVLEMTKNRQALTAAFPMVAGLSPDQRTTEKVYQSTPIDELTRKYGSGASVRQQIDAQNEAIQELYTVIPKIAEIARRVCDSIYANHTGEDRQAGRVFIGGAGTSGRLAILASAIDSVLIKGVIAGGDEAVFRAIEGAEDSRELAQNHLQSLNFSKSDIFLGFAASGTTPWTIGAVEYSRHIGGRGFAVSNNQGSPLVGASELGFSCVTGPEVVAGSTRLKAGTIQFLTMLLINQSAHRYFETYRLSGSLLNVSLEDIEAQEKRIQHELNDISGLVGASILASDYLAKAADMAAERLMLKAPEGEKQGRVIYVGADMPARLAVVDGAERTPTFGFPSERLDYVIAGGMNAMFKASHDAAFDQLSGAAQIRALDLTERDVVIGVSIDGNTPFTVEALKAAKDSKALVISMCNRAKGQTSAIADVAVFLNNKAETHIVTDQKHWRADWVALKIMLNAWSTQTHVLMNDVYQGLMTRVQINNHKLVLRAIRTVAQLADCTPEQAYHALYAADGEVSLAIPVAKGADIERAQQALSSHQGNIGRALQSLNLA